MSKRKLDLQEIHKYEVDLLKIFVEISEENNLKYYLAGGSLLGAIRHKGFIPWDDDIDILMPRPDYMKFQEIDIKKYCPKNVKRASYELGNLNYPFCKLFNMDIHIDKEYIFDSTETNLWIDILPMDALPNDEKKINRIFKKSLLARRILKLQKAVLGKGTSKFKIILKYILKPIVALIGMERVLKYINKLALKYDYDQADLIGGIVMGYGPQETMQKSEYIPIEKVEFEGMIVNAPKCWDYYLKSLFGNYMVLPPEDKRQVHIMTMWIDE